MRAYQQRPDGLVDPNLIASAYRAEVIPRRGLVPPCSWRGGKGPVYGGLLQPQENGSWRMLIEDGPPHSTRFSIAHEVGHILLYQSGTGVDRAAWDWSRPTEMEEAVCNYIARALLVPSHLIIAPREVNASEWIVKSIARQFRVPVFAAVLRGLELKEQIAHDYVAAICWRQRPPFDAGFVRGCLREHPDLQKDLLLAAHDLRVLCRKWSMAEQWEIWSEIIGSAEFLLRPPHEPRLRQVVDRTKARIASCRSAPVKSAVAALADPFGARSFAPVWAVWSEAPEDRFIPFGHGGARPDSVVGRVGEQRGDVGETAEEDVSIGSLQGRFRVHTYSTGCAAAGERYVLAVYERPQPTRNQLLLFH